MMLIRSFYSCAVLVTDAFRNTCGILRVLSYGPSFGCMSYVCLFVDTAWTFGVGSSTVTLKLCILGSCKMASDYRGNKAGEILFGCAIVDRVL